jgi:two-component system, LytTR family, response regulator
MTAYEPLRILAVDDERPARDDLVEMLKGMPCVGRVAAAASAMEALAALDQDPPFHAVMLDVRMPGLSGVELGQILRGFERPPVVVFVSAHDRYAVDAFAMAALDYLLKPVARGRLQEAVRRIAVAVGARSAPGSSRPDAGVVSVDTLTGGGTHLVLREDIMYLQTRGDYVRVVCPDGTFLLHARLTDLEKRWSQYGFVRVHRRFLINLRGAAEIQPLHNGTAVVLMRDGSRVPVARRQASELRRRLSW